MYTHIYIYVYIYIYIYLQATASAADLSVEFYVVMSSLAWRHESLRAAGAVALLPGLVLGPHFGSLWRPVAATCGPYKKISDQICSILHCLLEA